MPMLTYDLGRVHEPESVNDMLALGSGVPDVIEIGENSELWYHVSRSARTVRLTSKVDGRLLMTVGESELDLLSPQIADAARRAMELRDRV